MNEPIQQASMFQKNPLKEFPVMESSYDSMLSLMTVQV